MYHLTHNLLLKKKQLLSTHYHPVTNTCAALIKLNFSSGLWSQNGPLLLLRVLRRWCNVNNLLSMDYIRCQGFHILPSSSFFPVHYNHLGLLFENQRPNEKETTPEWLTDQVVGVHTWNKLSFNWPIHKNSTQTYNRLARDNCPLTYLLAPNVFWINVYSIE